MTANASLADREGRLAAGMNDHVAKPIDKERLVLCLLGHLGRSGARARRQRQRTRANWSRRGAISSGVSAAALELIVRCCGASFRTGPRSAERQLGEGDVQGSAATLHTIKGSASTVGASALAGRASELEQALRRLLRGMEILAGIRPTNCAPSVRCLPAPPAGDVRRRAGGSRRAEPRRGGQSAKDSGGPGARLHPLRPVGRNNAMGVIRRYFPEARPGLERHPLPVVQYLQASRSRSWALSRA